MANLTGYQILVFAGLYFLAACIAAALYGAFIRATEDRDGGV